MKFKPKSAFIHIAVAGFAALLLASCSDTDNTLPHVFGGNEVPPELINQPRVVRTPASVDMTGKPWPRLGDVPSKPQTFSPPPVLDQAVDEMEFDRNQARRIENDYEATHPDILKQDK